MTTPARLGKEQRRRFEEAKRTGYLVDPTPEESHSRLFEAWEAYCREHDLPLVTVSRMPDSNGRYARVDILTDARGFDAREYKFDMRESGDESPGPWDEARQEAMNRFGVKTQSRESSIVSENTWASFENFPAGTVEELAAFVVEKVRAHRVPCPSNHQVEEAHWEED